MSGILTYGGVSLFVVAFAVYPFGAELFRASDIPKRLLPATIALGAFTFTMDALPGSPQIQNIIPTTFFGTNSWAAPRLGVLGALFLFAAGILYLEWRRRRAHRQGEGYGADHISEQPAGGDLPRAHSLLAATPLLLVGVLNWWLTQWMPRTFPAAFDFTGRGISGIPSLDTTRLIAIWSVLCALAVAIAVVIVWCVFSGCTGIMSGLNAAIGGAMLAALNTGSEYGFGAVIAVFCGRPTSCKAASGSEDQALISGRRISPTRRHLRKTSVIAERRFTSFIR